MISNAILNDKGKVDYYICSECGEKYHLRYADSTLCPTCRIPIHRELQKKLGTNIKFK